LEVHTNVVEGVCPSPTTAAAKQAEKAQATRCDSDQDSVGIYHMTWCCIQKLSRESVPPPPPPRPSRRRRHRPPGAIRTKILSMYTYDLVLHTKAVAGVSPSPTTAAAKQAEKAQATRCD
jgi:uncharacterized membrane protein